MKTTTFSANNVKLIVESTEIDEMAASAAISLNPHVTWLKITLTDDLPNANKQKIPRSEFANVLRTGVFMPLKMGYGKITEGHDEVFPIGTFAHLKTEANTIEALVALWNREREKDVEFLKERHASGKPIDVSWEVTYTEEDVDEEDGSVALKNVSMNGAAIVGMPAYEGRTSVTALSTESDNKKSSKKGESSDMDEEKKYTQRINELEEKVEELETKLSESQAELNEIKPKYESLAEFKEKYDEEQAKLAKIASIKEKFSDAELKLEDDYVTEKIDMFLDMSDEQLDFFIQELSAFSANDGEGGEGEDAKSSVNLTSSDIPPMNRKQDKVDKQGILKFLSESNKKEE